MAQKKIKRASTRTARERKRILKRAETRFAERAWQERLAWLRRPRLHTAMFEKVVRDEEIIGQGGAIITNDDPAQKVEAVAKEIGWSDWRLDIFSQVVVAYRRSPTIENYVRVRRLFPEVEIQVARFSGLDSLFVLESDFKKQGVDPDLVAAALEDADEPATDALCLHLLECLIARSKLPKTGPGHIAKRRSAISDATVNYLISTMLESFDWHEETFRIPASLVVLIRHQLCGLKPDLHEEYLLREKRHNVALLAAQQLKAGERLSINKLVAITGIPRSTAARWLADQEFQQWLEVGRKWAADGLFRPFLADRCPIKNNVRDTWRG